jgi:uncharacterized protein YdeI (YjbR/CyaY-like superfamily)
MDIGKTLRVKNREEWHKWLAANFDKEKEIWLIYPGKNSSELRIQYNDAVEEALSFGWIDSIVKPIGKNVSAQRFSPRNPKSKYSQANKERLKWLLNQNMLHPSVKNKVEEILQEECVFPSDIIKEIKSNNKAWENFQNFSPAYKRIRIAYIDNARRRPQEFEKRLNYFLKSTEKNKLIGFGGIEKYY